MSRAELQARVAEALQGQESESFVGYMRVGTAPAIVAVLAVEGHYGVFIGYGQTEAAAEVDAWRNMRERNGAGYESVQQKARRMHAERQGVPAEWKN